VEHALEVAQLGGEHFVTRRRFKIDSQQLLVASTDDAQLDRGFYASIAVKTRVDALAPEELLQPGARLVRTDDRQQAHPGAQRRGIAGDVRGAPGALLFPHYPDDGDGGFGRDALDLAEPVAIEHRVADH